jgi:hypothetical protein
MQTWLAMSVRCCQDFFNDLSTSITGAASPPVTPPRADPLVRAAAITTPKADAPVRPAATNRPTEAIGADQKAGDAKRKEKAKKYFISGYNIFNYDIKEGVREEVEQKMRQECQGQALDVAT